MATVYIIAAEADIAFVEQHVLPYLPSNGYGQWIAGFCLGINVKEETIYNSMNQCGAVITVVSKRLPASFTFKKEMDIAFASPKINIVLKIENKINRSTVPERLWRLPLIDLAIDQQKDIGDLITGLLPPQAANPATDIIPAGAITMRWNVEIFSKALSAATASHDHARALWLIANFSDYANHNLYEPYPDAWAITDMQSLRQEREFKLMVSYGNVVLRTGTKKDKFKRLFAQALIETMQYDAAMEVLNAVLSDTLTVDAEVFEARGLIGRIYKQRYMNNPAHKEAAYWLQSAIRAYGTAYLDNRENFWHGVNTASCIIRFKKDNMGEPDFAMSPYSIATQIIQDLDILQTKQPLPVWDCTSKVEALIILEKYEEAKNALEVYIHHKDMTAFEVSSTYRQFVQVLQLDRIPECADILNRLRYTMERYRAGTVLTSSVYSRPAKHKNNDESKLKALVIRLSDPSWIPRNMPGLAIHSRLDKIVTAEGSDQDVRRLLDDPMIISVEASRPAGLSECHRSLQYINVSKQYPSPAGVYEETGKRVLVAVIDDSIDVLHKAFLDAAGNCRIVGVWDQTDKQGKGVFGFNYGVFHDKDAIVGFIQTRSAPPRLGQNGMTHGTHVASIAAGRKVDEFAGGVAPDAKILVVIPNNAGPTGYSKSYIDALSFINTFADTMPVVVNVSQGMNAGAHDGKSALEAAFDVFSGSGRNPGRVVVKSAGNERAKAGHARITLLTGGLEELSWVRSKGAGFTEKIELWWSSANELRFRLREPVDPAAKKSSNQPGFSDWVGTTLTDASGVFANGGGPYHLRYTKRHIDNGDSLLEIELGLDVDTLEPAGIGQWLLQIEALEIKGRDTDIHCWIERGDGVPTSFEIPHVSEDMTLSVPGTAESVITVGAVDASKPIRVGGFSSYGPTRRNGEKPQVCAPGINVIAAEAGTGSGVLCLSGTSMAAPHVTGAIALLLSRCAGTGKLLNANQIARALCQKTQNFNGNWDRGQGYGVLDVAALLAAFE